MSGALWTSPAATSVLAIITTVHLGILLLCVHHRPLGARHSLLLAPSVALSASPWILPTLPATGFGLLLHFLWFGAYHRILPTAPGPARPTANPQPESARTASPAAERPRPGFVQVPVIHVMRETDDIATFRMARPEGFEFKAGQFLTVRVNVDGQPAVRCYTISSAPEARGYLEISVKRQGILSGTLHATIRAGSMLAINAAAGNFVYPSTDDRPLALIAGGVGITPMMCMLRHAVHSDPTRPVTLLYSVHSHRDVAFRDELRLLAARNPQLKIRVTTTRGPHETGQLSGRIDGRMICQQVANLSNTIFMICGPAPMIDGITAILAELGVPDSQVRSEAFEAAIASSVTPGTLAGGAPSPPRDDEAAFQLHLVDTGATLPVSCSSTLLESCEAAGYQLPAVCRSGVCGTCRARLASGRVRCESELLDESELAEGYILPCVSWPEEDCALEA
jgi:ferredoxin-NADP reductase